MGKYVMTVDKFEDIINTHIKYYAREAKYCKNLRQELVYRAKISALEKLIEDIKE